MSDDAFLSSHYLKTQITTTVREPHLARIRHFFAPPEMNIENHIRAEAQLFGGPVEVVLRSDGLGDRFSPQQTATGPNICDQSFNDQNTSDVSILAIRIWAL